MPVLSVARDSVPIPVRQALQNASARTGVTFDHLLRQANAESGLKVDAAAKTSSARGLFQFIDQTWLGLVKKYGHEIGLRDEASAITLSGNGRTEVDSPDQRQAILALRENPEVSAFMAAKLASDNRAYLNEALGRDVSAGELALAHFLGAQGAARVVRAAERDPSQSAVDLLPSAAASNKPVFYAKNGDETSVGVLVARFEERFGMHTERATDSSFVEKKVQASRAVNESIVSSSDSFSYPERLARRQTINPTSSALTAVSYTPLESRKSSDYQTSHSVPWIGNPALMTMMLTEKTPNLLGDQGTDQENSVTRSYEGVRDKPLKRNSLIASA